MPDAELLHRPPGHLPGAQLTGPQLRPIEAGDDEFLLRLYAGTREEELAALPWSPEQKAAFLAQQFAAQTSHYARQYPGMSADVVVLAGEPAGRLLVARSDDEILVVDISLLPAFRGRGVGTALLRGLLDEAAAGRRLCVHVEMDNPARRLYERLGFRPVSEHGIHVLLERTPT